MKQKQAIQVMVKQVKTVSMEESLWQSCNKMRGSLEPSEYKHVVLSLMFFKYAGDHFEQHRQKIISEGHAAFTDMEEFYEAKNVFFLPPEISWSFVMENAKHQDVTIRIDKALSEVLNCWMLFFPLSFVIVPQEMWNNL